MKRLYGLDIFRFIASFGVIFFHFCFLGVIEGYYSQRLFNPIFFWGYFGVDIFFIISGFVILISAEKKNSAWSFLKSRMKRIYPVLILTSFVTIITGLILGGSLNEMLPKFFNSLVFISDFWDGSLLTAVHWTLVIEVKFYILVAITKKLKIWANHKYLIMVFWLFFAFINMYLLKLEILNDIFILEYSCHFVIGILLYLFFIKKERSYSMLPICSFAIWMLYRRMAGYLSFVKDYLYNEIPYTNFDILFFIIIILSVIIFLINCKDVPINKKLAIKLGTISYPIYLIHGDLGFFIKREIFLNLSTKYSIFRNEYFIVFIEIILVLLTAYIIVLITEKGGSLLKKIRGGRNNEI